MGGKYTVFVTSILFDLLHMFSFVIVFPAASDTVQEDKEEIAGTEDGLEIEIGMF